MIVLDASLVVELLTLGKFSDSINRYLATSSGSWIVPHLLDIEVLSAIRKLVSSLRIDPHSAEIMVTKLSLLKAERYAHIRLLPRIWELRHNFTCYDAAYIALAEATNSTLLTMDKKLNKGHRAEVKLFTEDHS